MTISHLTRRSFLGLFSIAAIGGATSYFYVKFFKSNTIPARWVNLFKVIERELGHSSLVIGDQSLQANILDRDVESICEHLFDGPSWQGATSDKATSLFSAQVQKDYETGNTVSVDGWYLSYSEVRYSALVALTVAPSG